MVETVKTQCPYCGVGCGLEASPPAQPGRAVNRDKDGIPIWGIRGDRNHQSSLGQVCVKGATIGEVIHRNRLKHPMMRESLDQPLRQVSWDEALDAIANQIRHTLATQGPNGVAMYGSGQFQTEDYYTAQKLLKGCLGTNNFDANSRLCMSSAVAGYAKSLGSDGPPCAYEDLDLTDCAFLIGTNTAECHPIIFNRLRKNHKKNGQTKLIVVDPRATDTSKFADLHLQIQPGTDIDLMNGIAHLLVKWGKLDQTFITNHTTGFEQVQEIVTSYTPDKVAERCGITAAEVELAAQYWGESDRVLSMWSMGMNQSSEGTAKVRTLINLHLMTGQIGKPGAGPFSLTGQPNAMGGREAGGLAHLLPGYRFVANAQHRQAVEEFWRLPAGRISDKPGLTVWDMVEAMETGNLGIFWVAATNPAVSLPDIDRVKAALRKSPFTVYQESYFPTEMVEFAHVLLPASQWSEKAGMMTNSERRVTYCPQFRTPAGESRADWTVFAEVGRRLGFVREFAFNNSAEVYAEFVRLTRGQLCDQSGLSHNLVASIGAVQWPAPRGKIPDPMKTTRLYLDRQFPTPDGKARFAAYHSRGLAEPPDGEFPFVLTTGRLYGHWHTQSRTGRIDKIVKMHPNPFVEIHPKSAEKMGIVEGDLLEVRSRRGAGRFPAMITKRISPGTVFVPMHWGALWADQSEANAMTHELACPESKQPELKACAVNITLVAQILRKTESVEAEKEFVGTGKSLWNRLVEGLRRPI
ncbi:nitrate reductase [filamentous cyanobacterium LEGE 11480]|uniref:Nitrate reductase n=1 Tax=Romeriopsis navalis LEGE 11480 TaxID=2777977 RepID=A0A928VS87_9CYAN|nr:nitrate reductase [Romeriopsis navalis]MBE9032036.1 nitrate reductase [Romeriopsis navalis LEGE 11480]